MDQVSKSLGRKYRVLLNFRIRCREQAGLVVTNFGACVRCFLAGAELTSVRRSVFWIFKMTLYCRYQLTFLIFDVSDKCIVSLAGFNSFTPDYMLIWLRFFCKSQLFSFYKLLCIILTLCVITTFP